MSFSQNSNLNTYLPFTETFPENLQSLVVKLSSVYSNIAYKTNKRVVGIYDLSISIPTGKSYYPSSTSKIDQRRESIRCSYEFVLSAGPTTTSVSHNIDVTNKIFTLIDGTVNSPSFTSFVPLGYYDGTDSATVKITPTQIQVTTISNAFDGYIVLVNLELMPSWW